MRRDTADFPLVIVPFMAPFSPLIEPLEDRIAPASLVGPNTVIYTDADGDSVTLKISKPLFTSAAVANSVLTYSSGPDAVGTGTGAHEQLQLIDLTKLGGNTAGLSVSVAVSHPAAVGAGAGGDGHADIGYINATGIDLGVIRVAGDLGRIDAGNTDTAPALRALGVLSIGTKGLTTQAAGGTLVSNITGPAGSINVAGDVDAARINLLDAPGHPGTGSAGVLRIGGALHGAASDNTGLIFFTGKIVRASVGGMVGDAGANSGSIMGDYGTLSSIGTITVASGITGGAGTASGEIAAARIGAVQVLSQGVTGSMGNGSGLIQSPTLGRVSIVGDLKGGSGLDSGQIFGGAIGSVRISGSVLGGTAGLGAVAADPNAVPPVAARSAAAGGSGSIMATSLGRIVIGGSLVGGDYQDNDHTASLSGVINARDNIGSVVIGNGSRSQPGGIVGGTGHTSGGIFAGGTLGPTAIFGSVTGASSTATQNVTNSAYIQAAHLPALFIGGNVQAGGDGGAGIDSSGAIRSQHEIGSIFIKGDLVGTMNTAPGNVGVAPIAPTFNPAIISAAGQQILPPNATADIAIRSVTIGGSAAHAKILAGYSTDTTGQTVALGKPVNADASIGIVRIGKTISSTDIIAGVSPGADGVFGEQTAFDDARISGPGTTDRADIISRISRVIIGGGVVGTAFPADSYGIEAQQVVSVVVHGAATPLTPGASNDLAPGKPVGGSGSDLYAIEVA